MSMNDCTAVSKQNKRRFLRIYEIGIAKEFQLEGDEIIVEYLKIFRLYKLLRFFIYSRNSWFGFG